MPRKNQHGGSHGYVDVHPIWLIRTQVAIKSAELQRQGVLDTLEDTDAQYAHNILRQQVCAVQ